MGIWSGDKIRLRAPEESDSVLFKDKNGNIDTDTAKFYDVIEFPKNARQMADFLENANKNSGSDDFLFTAETFDGVPVGQVTAFDCDRKNGSFKYGLFVHPDYKGKGYASEAAKILLNYYFNQLRYHKANIYIYADNAPSIAFHQKLGFEREGLSRESAFFDGSYHDVVYMGLIDRDFNKLYK